MKIKENKRNLGKGIGGVLCLAISILLLMAANQISGFGEWYASRVYPVFVASIGRFFVLFPWSMAEIGLYLMAAALPLSFLYTVYKILFRKAPVRKLLSWLLSWFLTAGVLALLYTLLCGINYHRRSFAEHAGLAEQAYTATELKELCLELTQEVNRLSVQVNRDENGCMELSDDVEEKAVTAMKGLGREYKALNGFYPRPKALAVPALLSVQNLTGIYSPFTVEANYNGAITAYNIPFTACHELSHLRGFMEEEEANFIAYLACVNFDQEEFQYSGNLLAWIYSMNELYRADREAWRTVRGKLDEAVEADLAANQAFWKQYEGPVAEVSNKVNDTYLKANGQTEGVRSYDRMVDLLVAYREKENNK